MVAHDDSFILDHKNKKEKTPLKIIGFSTYMPMQ
jgi:hypothetical protein